MSDDRPSGRYVVVALTMLLVAAITFALLTRGGSVQRQPASSPPPLAKVSKACLAALNSQHSANTSRGKLGMGKSDLARVQVRRSAGGWTFTGTMQSEGGRTPEFIMPYRFQCHTDAHGQVQRATSLTY